MMQNSGLGEILTPRENGRRDTGTGQCRRWGAFGAGSGGSHPNPPDAATRRPGTAAGGRGGAGGGEARRRWRLVATRWGAGAASPWLGRRGGEREAAEARREAAAAEDGGGEARAAGAGRRGLQCGERRRRMGPARPGSARGGPDLGPEWHGGGGRWRR